MIQTMLPLVFAVISRIDFIRERFYRE